MASSISPKMELLIEAARKRILERAQASKPESAPIMPSIMALAVQDAVEALPAPEPVVGTPLIKEGVPFDFFTINGIVLNEQQRKAVQMFGIEGVSGCLMGPAGTGKTTTTYAIVRAMMHLGRIPIIPKGFEHKYMHGGTPGIWGGSFTRIATRNLKGNVPPDIKHNIHTIHKLLEFQPVFYETINEETGRPKTIMNFEPSRNRIKPLCSELKVFIIDESSMVGTGMYQLLLDAISNTDAQFIFIGDLAQLPPIFEPAILGYKLLELPVIELTEVYRHAGRIVNLANHIRTGNTIPALRSMLQYRGTKFAKNLDKIRALARKECADIWNGEEDGSKVTFQFLSERLTGENGKLTTLIKLSQFFKSEIEAGKYIPETDMILVPFNVGVGSIDINNYIADFLSIQHNRVVFEVISGKFKHCFAVGDKVFFEREEAEIVSIKRNERYVGRHTRRESVHMDRWGGYRRMIDQTDTDAEGFMDIDALLASTAIGKDAEEIKNQCSHAITVRKYGEEETFTISTAGEVNNLLMGYALTVHKSQGSQWRKVYVIFHNSHNTKLQREMVYTAITRAQKELHIICEPESFVIGVESQRIKGNTLAEKAEYFKGRMATDKAKETKQRLLGMSDTTEEVILKMSDQDTDLVDGPDTEEDIQDDLKEYYERNDTEAEENLPKK